MRFTTSLFKPIVRLHSLLHSFRINYIGMTLMMNEIFNFYCFGLSQKDTGHIYISMFEKNGSVHRHFDYRLRQCLLTTRHKVNENSKESYSYLIFSGCLHFFCVNISTFAVVSKVFRPHPRYSFQLSSTDDRQMAIWSSTEFPIILYWHAMISI